MWSDSLRGSLTTYLFYVLDKASCKNRRCDLPVFPVKAIAEGGGFIRDAENKCFF